MLGGCRSVFFLYDFLRKLCLLNVCSSIELTVFLSKLIDYCNHINFLQIQQGEKKKKKETVNKLQNSTF